jgi:hypothetical protein
MRPRPSTFAGSPSPETRGSAHVYFAGLFGVGWSHPGAGRGAGAGAGFDLGAGLSPGELPIVHLLALFRAISNDSIKIGGAFEVLDELQLVEAELLGEYLRQPLDTLAALSLSVGCDSILQALVSVGTSQERLGFLGR